MDATRILVYFLFLINRVVCFSGYEFEFNTDPLVPRALLVSANGTAVRQVATTQFTFCVFANLRNQSSQHTVTLVSFSSQDSKTDNEILFEIDAKQNYSMLTLSGRVGKFLYVPPHDQWVHICVSWESTTGIAILFVNGKEYASETKVICGNCTIGGNGYFVLGQEQDSYDGDYEASQGFQGKMTEFHLWDRLLTLKEREAVRRCKSIRNGSIVNWQNSTWAFYDGIQVLLTSSPCGTCGGKRRCLAKHTSTSALDMKKLERTNTARVIRAQIDDNFGKDISFCFWHFFSYVYRLAPRFTMKTHGIATTVLPLFIIVSFECFVSKECQNTLFSGKLAENQWHHLCLTYNGTSGAAIMYVAGKLRSSTTVYTKFSAEPFSSLFLTQYQWKPYNEHHPTQGFSVKMTEYNLWDRVLTAGEVEDVYCDGSLQGNIFNWKKPNWKICPPYPVTSPLEQVRKVSGNNSILIRNEAVISAWPEQNEFSFCARFYARDDKLVSFEHLILSVSNGPDIRIATSNEGYLVFNMNNATTAFKDVGISFTNWHQFCLVWSNKEGVLQAFKGGELKQTQTFQANYKIPPVEGVELRQLQYGSGNESNTIAGFRYKITDFQWWNHRLSKTEVAQAFDCSGSMTGNLFNYGKAEWEEPKISKF